MKTLLLLLLLVAVAAGVNAGVHESSYSQVTASTAKEDYRAKLVTCSFYLGYPVCAEAGSCKGNCSLAMRALIEENERFLMQGVMYCFTGLQMPHQ
jgi:hypothetical protein